MSSLKFKIICLFMLMLSGCGIFKPFVDRRRNPGVSDLNLLYSGPSRENAPAICYNPLFSSAEELQKIADEECIKNETGIRAEFVQKTYMDGRLLLPNHAYYQCVNE